MLIRSAQSLGQLIHDRRRRLGWSQTALGERIGASRYWVGEVEKGKPTAEVGLVLSALQALGLAIDVHSTLDADEGTDRMESTEEAVRLTGGTRRPNLTRGGESLRASRDARR